MKRKLEQTTLSSPKCAKLSTFGFSTPTKENCEPCKDSPSTSKPRTPLTPRNFKDVWKFGHSWLRYDNKLRAMFCDTCVRAQVCNSFTTGCTVMKKESVIKHESAKGNNSHARALEIVNLSKDLDTARETAVSKNKDAIIAALRNVFFAAVNDMPNSTVSRLNDLCIEQGCEQLRDLNRNGHATYNHNQSVEDFQTAIAKVLEDRLVDRIRRSDLFSIMIDESTDISVHQNLLVYIRILEEVSGRWVPKSHFLAVRQMSHANADSITSEVLQVFSDKGLDISKFVGLATDGAAVMVGCRSGVATRLKEECPGLLSVHCIAHRLALGCGSGADKVRYLVKFQEILNSIFKYFHFSPKHMAALEGIQAVLDGVGHSRFKQVFHTRWLSFEGSVHALVRNYSAMLSVFLEENSAKSLSLHKPVSNFKFLYCAHFLSDVLKHLSILSKCYQKSELEFSEVEPLLKSTISVLENLRDSKSGPVLQEFLKVVPSEPVVGECGSCVFEFKGHTIRDSVAQRSEAVSACEQFVSHTVSSLKDRFSDRNDSKIMSAVSEVLNPDVDREVSAETTEVVVEYLEKCGLGDASCLKQELIGFSAYVKAQVMRGSQGVRSVFDVAQLGLKCAELFPVVSSMCRRFLVLPVSTVDCERGFSRQNLIKTSQRNRLSARSLDHLLRISIDGEQETMDFDQAFKLWASAKPRRILKE